MAGIDEPFDRFLRAQKPALRRIARATRGECELSDVINEAWLLAESIRDKGRAIDFDRPEDQSLVLSHLYQALVRYTELTVRHAVQLDHHPGGATEGDAHPLIGVLAGPESGDPLKALIAAEGRVPEEAEVNPHDSLASAYFVLLQHLGNDVRRVSGHLLISLSHCYRRLARARALAATQIAVPPTLARCDDFIPRPWRRYRAFRSPLQLELDLGCEPELLPEA